MRTEQTRPRPRPRPTRTCSPPLPRAICTAPVILAVLLLVAARLGAQMEFRGPVGSLYTDDRFYKVGDVVTVIVDERMSGINNAQFRSQRGTDTQAEFGAGPGKVFGLLNPFGGQISTTNDFDSRVQNNKLTTFTTQVSAQVVRTDESGNLYLEGSKVIELPDEKQVVYISGVVRNQDVTPQNTVLSSQIANLQVKFKGKGEAEEARHPTLFNRILNWFF